ncbi:MAG: hypothetical protein KKC80_08750 [Candidatus Margulisbacteria bacterium]|nr:hypothetical protein [Candidatus Margulisiibacteriota bacterium]MBU1235146.1 hypothetical protein [Pseudomonadota bacterium]MBU1456993.1 hypothetical protein [Pseudomonadota bacterium]
MTNKSWIQGGFEQVQEDYAEMQDSKKPYRFWLSAEDTAEIIFLDNFEEKRNIKVNNEFISMKKFPIIFNEHQVKFDGNWNSHFTCSMQSHGECPICELGDKPYRVYMLTVAKSWVDESTGIEKWSKNVFASKNKGIKVVGSVLANKALAGKIQNNLQFCRCTVTRTSAEDVKTGNQIQFIDKLTSEDIKKLMPEYGSYDFDEIYEAQDPNKIRLYISQHRLEKNPPYNKKFVASSSKPSKIQKDIPIVPKASSFSSDFQPPQGDEVPF